MGFKDVLIEQALQLILQTSKSFGKEIVSLDKCTGRILSEDVLADRDYPPFNRSAMDGYACRSEDLKLFKKLDVIEEIHAGAMPSKAIVKGACSKIMTGAPVPQGADAVVKVEESRFFPSENKVGFTISSIRPGANISVLGEDCKKATVLIEKGTLIDAGVYSVLATLGKTDILVCKIPKIAVISTGNELRGTGEKVLPFQIRDSNSYSVESFLMGYKIPLYARAIVKDNPEQLKEMVQANLDVDLLIISGGVSMGDADHVPETLIRSGFKEIFHKVLIKPGKPLWFGVNEKGTVVFALPGNPLSVQVTLRLFIEPYVRTCLGLPQKFIFQLPLIVPKSKKTKFDEFFPCRFINASATSLEPARFNGSGDISAVLGTDGFAWHFREKQDLIAGDLVPFFIW